VDALELVASYLFDQAVKLEATAVGLTAEAGQRDETSLFLSELEARHAIACAMRLQDVLMIVERNVSTSRWLAQSESKGDIRGRINFPQYLARRHQQIALPRSYPVITTEETPQTPENALMVQALRGLALQLGSGPFPRNTAEGQTALALYTWVRARLRRHPWAIIKQLDSIDQLQKAVIQRIRKRQTGNELGYQALLDWIAEWRVNPYVLGAESVRNVVQGLLAFPHAEFFQNKVFEVWCLREVAQSLERCGCQRVAGPLALEQRKVGPIYTFRSGTAPIEVWFQRQQPLSTTRSPRWRYVTDNLPLRGIPDVVVQSAGRSPLIIDAKFRRVVTNTRAEETYKLLGYAENFRDSIGEGPFQGVLVFVGPATSETVLTGPHNGRISLIIVDDALRDREAIRACFDRAVAYWLEACV
jgi:hypothetical protein